jgi:hypothetical protein
MKKKSFFLMVILTGSLSFLAGEISEARAMGKGVETPSITKEQLLSMIEKPEVVIVDVREGESWKGSKEKIRGSVREDPEKDIQGWYDRYPREKTLVFYCS